MLLSGDKKLKRHIDGMKIALVLRKELEKEFNLVLGDFFKRSKQPNEDETKVSNGGEIHVEFVVASSEAAMVFELLKQILHQMPFLVFICVNFSLDTVGNTAWDNGDAASLPDILAELLLVTPRIGKNFFIFQIKRGKHILRIYDVVARSGR
jgi:hypothetical protein